MLNLTYIFHALQCKEERKIGVFVNATPCHEDKGLNTFAHGFVNKAFLNIGQFLESLSTLRNGCVLLCFLEL